MKHEIVLRLSFFLAIFATVACWEYVSPRRRLTQSKKNRWFINLAIVLTNPLLVRLIFPILAIDMALKAQQQGWGLMNYIELPLWLNSIIGVAILDLALYFYHVMFHAVPLLWRLHMVHHADLDYDLTTGLRFHPIEILLSMAVKLSAIAVIGPPVMAVLTFEIILNAMAMFTHGNIKMPPDVDRQLRIFLVTPDMHRVHHSVIIRETNSNYGFNMSIWDRLFGTYRAQPSKGHEGMTIGLSQFRNHRKLNLPRLLILPFVGEPGKQPINR